LLGNNITSVGWPKCGEIDIMENIGKEPGTVHGSLHGPSTTGPTSDALRPSAFPPDRISPMLFISMPSSGNPARCASTSIRISIATFSQSQWPAGGTWAFDHPFFIILNVAVGGDWPGPPDANTIFPQQMLVDYVRVYAKQ